MELAACLLLSANSFGGCAQQVRDDNKPTSAPDPALFLRLHGDAPLGRHLAVFWGVHLIEKQLLSCSTVAVVDVDGVYQHADPESALLKHGSGDSRSKLKISTSSKISLVMEANEIVSSELGSTDGEDRALSADFVKNSNDAFDINFQHEKSDEELKLEAGDSYSSSAKQTCTTSISSRGAPSADTKRRQVESRK